MCLYYPIITGDGALASLALETILFKILGFVGPSEVSQDMCWETDMSFLGFLVARRKGMKLMPEHSLRDLEALTGCFPWEGSFLEVALPPFLLDIAKCRGKPAAMLPHPPGLLCRGRMFWPLENSWQGLSGLMVGVGAELQSLREPLSSQGLSCAYPGLLLAPSGSQHLLYARGWSWKLRRILAWSSSLAHPGTGANGREG